jgi:heme A synthase
MPAWLQSILGIVAGFVVTAACVILGTLLAVSALLPKLESGKPGSPTPTYLAANILVSIAAAVLGGYVAAFIAGRLPLLHAGILAALFFVLGISSVVQGPQPGQPAWYPFAMLLIAPAGILIGGYLRSL